jgi:hypothetical protein
MIVGFTVMLAKPPRNYFEIVNVDILSGFKS